jgi:choline-sulfatase
MDFITLVVFAWVCSPPAQPVQPVPERPNVLFIPVDDLRPELGCYGRDAVKSPNLDRLAANGLLFNRAYCQMSLCMPSRSSLMTGFRPESINRTGKITGKMPPQTVTLPQLFRNHGYRTVSIGKVYHFNDDDPAGWVQRYTDTFAEQESSHGYCSGYQREEHRALVRNYVRPLKGEFATLPRPPSCEITDTPDETHPDAIIARRAIEELRKAKETGQPFFLAAGFYRPHLPWTAPRRYWDLYDRAKLRLPANFAPVSDGIARGNWDELRRYGDIPKEGPLPAAKAREMIHGYYASVSFVDAQIGKVLDELKRLGLDNNTIVMLWGDNGWNLGEHGLWSKYTNYETSTRVAMMISVPWLPKRGRTQALVELVDMYPSLCELCRLPAPDYLEGTTFVPLIKQPGLPWKKAAFSCLLARGACTIRTDRHRFIVHPDGQIELYDHQTDPGEDRNLAQDAAHQDTVRALRAALDAGWKDARPERR